MAGGLPNPTASTAVRLRGAGVIGSGLGLDGETIQLSAFTNDRGGSRAFGRIARLRGGDRAGAWPKPDTEPRG